MRASAIWGMSSDWRVMIYIIAFAVGAGYAATSSWFGLRKYSASYYLGLVLLGLIMSAVNGEWVK